MNKGFFLITIFLLTLVIFCNAKQKKNKDKSLVFSSAFTDRIEPEWNVQSAAKDRFMIVFDSALKKNVLRVNVKKEDQVIGHNRSELNLARHHTNQPFDVTDGLYTWKFRIPTDSLEKYDSTKWRVIGQWHDSPGEGNTWQKGQANTEPGHPPPVAMELLQKNGVWMLGIRYGVQKNGGKRRLVASSPIKENTWNDLSVHIHWSEMDDGYIEAKLNNKVMTPYNKKDFRCYGKNMYNNIPNTFKIGIYRSSFFILDDVVYYSDLRIYKVSDLPLF